MGVVNAGTPFLDRSPGVVCLARSVLATVMSIGSVVSSSSSDSYVSVCIGIRSSYPGLREMKLIIIPSLSLYFPLLSLSLEKSLLFSHCNTTIDIWAQFVYERLALANKTSTAPIGK